MKVLFQLLIAVFFFFSSVIAQTTPTPKEITSAALEEMKNFNSLSKVKEKKDLESVIKSVESSLKSELWLGDSWLMPVQGEAVFTEHKNAVKALEKMAKHKSAELSEASSLWINRLIVADQTLNIILFQDNLVGIDEGGCEPGNTTCLENTEYYQQAEQYYSLALQEVARGQNERAIDNFKQSWKTLGKMAIYSWVKATANEQTEVTPKAFELKQNYPNPFNPSTAIKFALPSNSFVAVKVYNAIGQEVATLVNGLLEAGYHEINFDASDLSSGLYIYRFEAASQTGEKFVQSSKMLLMK